MPNFHNIQVIDLAADDLVFSVQCDYPDIVQFFRNPTQWMADLTQRAGEDGKLPAGFTGSIHLTQDYCVQVRPVTEPEAVQIENMVRPYEGLSFAERQAAAGAAWESLKGFAAEPTFTVYGISGTGYVTLDVDAVTIANLLITEDWDKYWSNWQSQIRAEGALVLISSTRAAYFHAELTEDDDPERGEKLAIYLMCASRSAFHMNQLLQTPPAKCVRDGVPLLTNIPVFVQATPSVMAKTTFSFIENAQASVRACEVKSGEYVPPEGVIVPASAAAKIYQATSPTV